MSEYMMFEYSFFMLLGFMPMFNLVCYMINKNKIEFEKLNNKVNILIYNNEQLKTQIENIMHNTQFKEEEQEEENININVYEHNEVDSDIEFVQNTDDDNDNDNANTDSTNTDNTNTDNVNTEEEETIDKVTSIPNLAYLFSSRLSKFF